MKQKYPEVLFEDNHLLIVNKPAGMPVQGDKTEDLHLLDVMKQYIAEKYSKPGAVFLGLIHRLDRPVSGAVVLARTSKALERMNELFRGRDVKKVYHAITTRPLPDESGTLEDWMAKDAESNRAIVYKKEKPGSKKAVLHYNLRREVNGFYLYEITLETGRFHQIRAQLAKAGAPIVGDLKYGYPEPNKDRSIGLHSYLLSFVHPIRKEPIEVQAPYPASSLWQRFKGL